MPLAKKIERAAAIIRQGLEAACGRAVVSFSGGRDSTVLAELVRKQAPGIRLAYADTGLADARLTTWIKEYAGEALVHLPPGRDPETTWLTEGALPIGAKTSSANYRRANPELRIDPSKCCRLHKAAPMEPYLREIGCRVLFVGARGDDSTRHAFKLMTGETFDSGKGWLLSYPLLVWTQEDVFAWLRAEMPSFPLLYARNEEMGCRACAINLARWPNQMVKLRKSDPAYHRHLIVDVGYGLEILMIKYRLTRHGAEQLAAREGWDQLIAAGVFDRIPQARKGLK